MSDFPSKDVEVFSAAIELAVAERAAYLDKACHGDADLRKRVEALLREHEGLGDFLEEPPSKALAQGGPQAAGAKPGDRIGRYKLVKQLGEGGCGLVYLAEQEEPIHRQVALKIIKPGMDTRSVIARFEAERQALALMDHPNIAKVFDAGETEAGRPYFVMELVRGIKITDYCDQQSLTTEERLKLFVQVCQAVQHAHQKGIIHRDIKPSNILVTQSHEGLAVPMVIDFGIAKATTNQRLSDATVFTAFEMLIGTPAYMSPEQAALTSIDVDTRTDIYSLGVLLYELLTGSTPFETRELLKAGIDEVRRVIRDVEPVRPSTRLTTMTLADQVSVSKHHGTEALKLIREMRGDLDWIVMKALEKDRSRRFQTAEALAGDIQRYLKDETVSARPPSRLYQFQKLVSRHKVGFAAFGIVMATLVAGLSSTIWSLAKEKKARADADWASHDADVQRKKAETGEREALAQLTRSQQATKFMNDMLLGVSPAVANGRDTTLLREIFDKAAERVERELTNQPDVQADLRYTIGRAFGTVGLPDKEEPMLRSALAYYRRTPSAEQKVADTLHGLSFMHIQLNPPKLTEAEQEAREALAIDAKLLGDENMQVVRMKIILGIVLHEQGRLAEAETSFREAFATGRRLGADKSDELFDARNGLARTLTFLGKPDEAEPLLLESLSVAEEKYGPDHMVTANCLYLLALHREAQGQLEQAEALYRKCLAVRRKLVSRDHPHLEGSLNALGGVLRGEKKWKEATDVYVELLDLRRRRYGDKDMCVVKTMAFLVMVLTADGNEVRFEQLARDLPLAWIVRSEDLAQGGRWSESMAAAARFLQAAPGEYNGYYYAAPLLVQIGDQAAYEELSAKITTLFAGNTNPAAADQLAKACLISPRTGADLKVASELASVAVVADQTDTAAKCTKALAEYRQGHWDGAIDCAQKATENPSPSSRAEAYAILAMAQHHSKQTEAARVSLKTCTEIVETQLSKLEDGDLVPGWRDWILAHALQSEAKRMIEGEPSPAAPPAKVGP